MEQILYEISQTTIVEYWRMMAERHSSGITFLLAVALYCLVHYGLRVWTWRQEEKAIRAQKEARQREEMRSRLEKL